jgi:hypothetical protein
MFVSFGIIFEEQVINFTIMSLLHSACEEVPKECCFKEG